MPAVLHIDVYVDVICPWCLIGKHQLQRALDMLSVQSEAPSVEVQWHSVQLLPQVPEEGFDFVQFYNRRLGSPQAVAARQAQVRAAAMAAGVEVHFERIRRFPNTRKAHQLLALAQHDLDAKAVAALLDDVMCAYFQRGADLGDLDTLASIATKHGLTLGRTVAWLQSEQGAPVGHAVPGVPYFVFNRRLALSGAQAPETLLAAMQQALPVSTL